MNCTLHAARPTAQKVKQHYACQALGNTSCQWLSKRFTISFCEFSGLLAMLAWTLHQAVLLKHKPACTPKLTKPTHFNSGRRRHVTCIPETSATLPTSTWCTHRGTELTTNVTCFGIISYVYGKFTP
jgi:hypothetical protein